MKECPECGSVLADNEPYCENCGFDPGFDSGGWNHGSSASKSISYVPNKTDDNQETDDAALGCIFLICIFFAFAFMMYVYFS